MAEAGSPQTPRRLLTFGSIGWLLLLIAILLAGVMLRLLLPALKAQRVPTDVSNGFDLTASLIAPEALARGNARDSLPALSDPAFAEPADVAELNKHGKYLVSNDRVIGVVINGEARAYPLSILNWHEVINDTVGSTAIIVSYSPLCDSAAVFRRPGQPPAEFAASGLLASSNLLMYQQTGGDGNSLWSQLDFRAVSGPAMQAGEQLELLPSALLRWSDWLALHPETVVMSSETGWEKEYNANPYQQYFAEEKVRFPLAGGRQPGQRQAGDFERYLLLQIEGAWQSYQLSEMSELADSEGCFELDGLSFTYRPLSPQMDPPVLFAVDAEGELLPSLTGLRFALEAAGRL